MLIIISCTFACTWGPDRNVRIWNQKDHIIGGTSQSRKCF